MSDREMTLDEVIDRLPPKHRARIEYREKCVEVEQLREALDMYRNAYQRLEEQAQGNENSYKRPEKKEKGMNYENYAREEFRAAGWMNEDGEFNDEMQEAICTHVVELLKVFEEEGHSGSSAPYAINLFKKLANFEPIVPLTGEEWEWNQISDGLYQNRRCSHVFRDQNGAYDTEGRIFYDWFPDEDGNLRKAYYTNKESRVPITFPYTPTQEFVERKNG